MLSLFLLMVYSPFQIFALFCIILTFIGLITIMIRDIVRIGRGRRERIARKRTRNMFAAHDRAMSEINTMLHFRHFDFDSYSSQIPKRRNRKSRSHPLTNIFKDNV